MRNTSIKREDKHPNRRTRTLKAKIAIRAARNTRLERSHLWSNAIIIQNARVIADCYDSMVAKLMDPSTRWIQKDPDLVSIGVSAKKILGQTHPPV